MRFGEQLAHANIAELVLNVSDSPVGLERMIISLTLSFGVEGAEVTGHSVQRLIAFCVFFTIMVAHITTVGGLARVYLIPEPFCMRIDRQNDHIISVLL